MKSLLSLKRNLKQKEGPKTLKCKSFCLKYEPNSLSRLVFSKHATQPNDLGGSL